MKKVSFALLLSLPIAFAFTAQVRADGPQVAHMVYFQLKDNSKKAKQQLVEACNKLLSGHSGTVYYSAGVLAVDLKRPVNDRGFDVALHLVFKDKASHDKYQDHPRHLQFIKENKENWKNVRVFDAYVEEAAKQSRLDRDSRRIVEVRLTSSAATRSTLVRARSASK